MAKRECWHTLVVGELVAVRLTMPMTSRDTTNEMTLDDTIARVEELAETLIDVPLPDAVYNSIRTGDRGAKFGYFNGREITSTELRITLNAPSGAGTDWMLVRVSVGVGGKCEHLATGLIECDGPRIDVVNKFADIERIAIIRSDF